MFKIWQSSKLKIKYSSEILCEKCPNTEFFLVLIFSHTDLVRRFFFVNLRIQSECEKYGPEKTPHLDTFHALKEREKAITQSKNNNKKTKEPTQNRSHINREKETTSEEKSEAEPTLIPLQANLSMKRLNEVNLQPADYLNLMFRCLIKRLRQCKIKLIKNSGNLR